MGTDETSTVYATKLQDLAMTMSIASTVKMMKLKLWVMNIYTDNQAAIWLAIKLSTQSDQYLLQCIVKRMNDLWSQKIQIWIWWILMHIKISENEEMNRMIKTVVQIRDLHTEKKQITEIWHLIAICKTRLCQQIAKEWINDWKNETYWKKVDIYAILCHLVKFLNCVVYEHILIKKVTEEVERMLTAVNVNRVFT